MEDFLTQIKDRLTKAKLKEEASGDLFKKYFKEIDYFVKTYRERHRVYFLSEKRLVEERQDYNSTGFRISVPDRRVIVDVSFFLSSSSSSLFTKTEGSSFDKFLSELSQPKNFNYKVKLEEVLGQHLLEVIKEILPEHDIAFFNNVENQIKSREAGFGVEYDNIFLNLRMVGPIIVFKPDTSIEVKTDIVGVFLEKIRLSAADINNPQN